jgi:hypothetical protein
MPDIPEPTKAIGQPPPVTTQQIITTDQTINQSISNK